MFKGNKTKQISSMTGFGFVAEVSGDNIPGGLPESGGRGTGLMKQCKPSCMLYLPWIKKPVFTEVLVCRAWRGEVDPTLVRLLISSS